MFRKYTRKTTSDGGGGLAGAAGGSGVVQEEGEDAAARLLGLAQGALLVVQLVDAEQLRQPLHVQHGAPHALPLVVPRARFFLRAAELAALRPFTRISLHIPQVNVAGITHRCGEPPEFDRSARVAPTCWRRSASSAWRRSGASGWTPGRGAPHTSASATRGALWCSGQMARRRLQ